MSRLTPQSLIALILVGLVSSTLLASSTVIGVVSAEGTFRLDNAAASDHATLFDGNVIQTEETAPRIDLKDGAWMRFGTGSRARISSHEVELERGIGELGSAKNYEVDAKTLRIKPGSNSVVRVQVDNDRRVLVAALNAPVRVYNRTGILVANVLAGMTLSFDPQAGGPTTASASGCLLTKNGRYIVVDPNTKQIIELRGGTDLAKEAGNRVTISGNVVPGATPMEGANQVVGLTSVTHVAPGGCVATAASVGADPPTPPPGTPTSSNAPGGGAVHHASSTPYIIGGIAVAGGAIGAIVATRSSKSP